MGRKGRISADASPSVLLVRHALQARGLSQTELASAAGLTRDHLSRVLLGKVSFPRSRDTLHALAAALGLDPLDFPEYRHQLDVLPASTRRLIAHLKAKQITQAEWIRRIVPHYSEGHLQLVLRGGTPFPRDPEAIARFAAAAEADPLMFAEYLPLDHWRDRLEAAARRVLPETDAATFCALLSRLAGGLAAAEEAADPFAERLLQHFLQRTFNPAPASDPELDDALTYLPPFAQYQPEMQAVLRAIHAQRLDVARLSALTHIEADTLFALLNGQVKLKPGPIRTALYSALALPTDAAGPTPEPT